MTIKLELVDERVIVRDGLKALCSRTADLEVVAEAATGVEALRQAVICRPDVVVLEPVLPDMSGIDVTRCLNTELPGIKVLLLTAMPQESEFLSALEAGARGYLRKECGFPQLAATIRAMAVGVSSFQGPFHTAADGTEVLWGAPCCQRGEDFQHRLRALLSEKARAEVEQRQRLASALHDQIGQSLALAKIKLEALQIPLRELPGSAKELERITELLSHAIEQTRSLTMELASPIPEELPLRDALAALCSDFKEKQGIEVTLREDLRGEYLPPEVQAILLESVRELLVNVVKHANAAQVQVVVHRGETAVRVTVQDDGSGFDTTYPAGFGLFRMRQRVQGRGGEMVIVSAPGSGTAVTLSLPIPPYPRRND